MSASPRFTVAILAYPGMTMLDAIGPNEVLANSPHFDVTFVASVTQPVNNDHHTLTLSNLRHFSEIALPDILLIPGGPGDHAAMQSSELMDWIKKVDTQATLVTSVCTGALLLGQAGLLKGKNACTHWACLDELAALDALPKRRRFTRDGKYFTASGVSAGIDMALAIAADLVSPAHARELRFGIEYFPNQYHLLSSYSLPRKMLRGLSAKVMGVLGTVRQKLVEQYAIRDTNQGEETGP